MDIHTTLALVVAAAILVAAALIGFVVTRVFRLVTFGWRVGRSYRPRRRIEDALPRTPLHVRIAAAAKRAGRFTVASAAQPVRTVRRRLHVLPTPVGPVPVPTEHRPPRSQ